MDQKMAQAIHHDQSLPKKAKMGEDVIVEATLLSRCDFFLHTCSSVSTAVLFLPNPTLEHKAYMPTETEKVAHSKPKKKKNKR